ncbi:c-type cytochrome [Methylobacter tundripaludum]|jgi:mono/diheme cytochrome c family protein|uniref:c-type cytochrome n=1 Tax=Methylobacter tundripaludum TaxID=173365 RepID=UPI0004DED01B|nr:cytochrome c [Methylobacter tundripaludum]
MKKILLGAFGVLGLGAVTVIGLLQAGAIDMAADTPHSPSVHRLIEWAREQSIARGAADIVPPDDLSDAGRIRRGAGNYDAMCANCHLSPGIEDSEIRKGLYPTPPNLSKPANADDSDRTDARRFWIIKHGVKASGMPAWSKSGMEDEAIWDLTAFLKIMPSLSPEEYRRLVESSDGHSHGGQEEHLAEKVSKSGAAHPHGTKPHSHKHGAHKH